MNTIAKNTNKAKQAIQNATQVLCFSLSNNFSGQPLAIKPVAWRELGTDGRFHKMVEVTLPEFLTDELNLRHSKLTIGENGHYTLHIHSNLWYDFTVCDHDFVLQPDDLRKCSKCGVTR